MSKLEKGYVHVYTGNGKGKTTAAIGLAVRAAAAGMKTYAAQFMKNFMYGELRTLDRLYDYITVEQFGDDGFVFKKEEPDEKLVAKIKEGLAAAKEKMLSGEYDLIVLDEICVSHYFKLVTTEEILSFIKEKPESVELILTGRYCPPEVIEAADLVTEMKEIKHYYEKGVEARRGIES